MKVDAPTFEQKSSQELKPLILQSEVFPVHLTVTTTTAVFNLGKSVVNSEEGLE